MVNQPSINPHIYLHNNKLSKQNHTKILRFSNIYPPIIDCSCIIEPSLHCDSPGETEAYVGVSRTLHIVHVAWLRVATWVARRLVHHDGRTHSPARDPQDQCHALPT